MPFAALSPLAEVANTAWFSLQKGVARDQVLQPGCALKPHDLTDDIHDFADTAALIEQLDLVITVDTSVAHLAGALGKPVWVFLPRAPARWAHRRIHRDHQIELLDQRGGLGEIVDVVRQIVGLQRATGLQDLVARAPFCRKTTRCSPPPRTVATRRTAWSRKK